MRLRLCVAFASAVVAVGCGGGASVSGDGGRDLVYGPVFGRAVGGVQEPVTMSGASSTVVGVFGANFTSLNVNLAPETPFNEEQLLDQTHIGFLSQNMPVMYDLGTNSLYAVSNEPPLSASGLTFSGSGSQIATSEYDLATATIQLFVYNIDGSSKLRITSNPSLTCTFPSWSPTASRICFSDTSNIWAVNSNGTGATQLTFGPETENSPRFTADGSKIIYRKYDGTNYNLWQMASTGVGQVPIFTGQSVLYFDTSPTGNEVVIVYFNGSNFVLLRFNLVTGGAISLLTTADGLSYPTWSPTGSHIAYQRNVGGVRRLEMMRLSDRTTTTLMPLQSFDTFNEWSPLVRKKLFVGTAGAHHTNAAGFLYGTFRSEFRSLVTFDATTRNTVDIDAAPSSGSSSNYVATITAADSITMLRYNNGIANPRVTIVDPTQPSTFCQGAIVSFDASSGMVSGVLPFTRSRSGDKPTQSEEPNGTRVRGEFLSVWDGKGQKIGGEATEIWIERATGKVTVVR